MRKFALAAAVLTITPIISACGKTSDSGGSASSGGGSAATVGFAQLHADTFFGSIAKGLEQGLPGGKVSSINYNSDAGKETQAYTDFMTRQVDAIVTSPLDPKGSVSGIRRVAKDGIPVVCVNTCINDADAKKYTKGFVLSDNAALGEETGKYAAEWIKKNLNGTATIAALHCDIFDVCRLRKKNFLAALDKAGIKYKLVAQQLAYEPDKAVPAAEAILTAHSDVDVFWAGNDGAAIGEVKAIQSANKVGKVHVFGTDMSAAMGEALLDPKPVLLTTTGQNGIANGKKAAEIVRAALANKKIEPFVQLVPVINFNVENKADVKKWLAENK